MPQRLKELVQLLLLALDKWKSQFPPQLKVVTHDFYVLSILNYYLAGFSANRYRCSYSCSDRRSAYQSALLRRQCGRPCTGTS
ncbi:hypothetical protein PISMIDRAFT_159444 [Pisolithus microcarpus 441]|uniref:Uncharacterized protein n=1 Tax=Pisolithus microcarpus 441 TaxID=765257 RepID=A0A0C9YYW2_9AGAM|nr:hypothetical protein PISMIDRAFT_159444 [Pisolithus microcarpus 441]